MVWSDGARHLPGEVVFDSASLSMFPLSHRATAINTILAVANSRVCSYLLRVLSSDVKFNPGYVDRAAFVYPQSKLIQQHVDLVKEWKRYEVSTIPTERTFSAPMETVCSPIRVLRHTLEGVIESEMFNEFGLDPTDRQTILAETGTPAGWFPMIRGYDAIPDLPDCSFGAVTEITAQVTRIERRILENSQLDSIRMRLRVLFEAGPGSDVALEPEDDGTGDVEEDLQVALGSRLPIPSETFLEELSREVEIHPISIYWLLKEGIESKGWRCLPEELGLWANRVTVTILRLLGYRWPIQIDASEPVP